MKKSVFKGLDQNVFYEKLPNGLTVILLPFKNKKNYYVNYTTKYGSVDLNFICNGEEYSSPLGVAHFLEHKVFEQEDENDPFTFFSKTGTGCNAGTSYRKTSYYIYGINDLETNLDYLIDFVNSPYFTDENVEKEKGIIIEEIKMYNDNPDWILTEELQKMTFKNNPVKYDIAGYEDTVKSITKEDLYKCYEAFYNPNNMILIVSGGFNVDKIIKVIKNNKRLMSRKPNDVKVIREEEPKEVCQKFKEIKLHNVGVDKLSINFKIPLDNVTNLVDFNIYLSIILSIVFGNSSTFKEEMFSKKYASFVACDRLMTDDFLILEFYFELMSESQEELLNEIISRFKTKEITEEEFERYKKVLIATNVISSDNPEHFANTIINDIINFGKVVENRLDTIRSMDFKKFNELRNSIDLSNNAMVLLKKDK